MKAEIIDGEESIGSIFGPNPLLLLEEITGLFRYGKINSCMVGEFDTIPHAIDLQTMEEFTIKFTRN